MAYVILSLQIMFFYIFFYEIGNTCIATGMAAFFLNAQNFPQEVRKIPILKWKDHEYEET